VRDELRIPVPADAGTSTHWGEWMILEEPPRPVAGHPLVIDLSHLRTADPLFLARMRGCIDWHCSVGRSVRIVSPRLASVRLYLERMHLACDLPSGCECGLDTLGQDERSNVLIPIRRLSAPQDGDRLDEELADLYRAHFDGPLGGLAQAFSTTVSEMSDNATTHGRSEVGVSYVTAQRYPKGRCVLVIGDLGIGIPAHVRRAYPRLADDGDAIREATKEGITGLTGTGSGHRGYGYQCVIDDLKNKWIARGELRVWSGKGRFRVETRHGVQERRRAWTVEQATVGTWVRLELAGSSSF
jgi:hypothetical protein